MGKGFNNFMSKKDFHPSAIWNLKKVWEAKQKLTLDQNRQDDMRAQYEKEQEILNNKALLGDEKAKIGLSFMYDAPAGISKETKDGKLPEELEPKFEWQRKYNAPREEWAKGDDSIKDQPFGIQVRNVRCVKCHTWGHLNTDNECPLYNMSGNHEDPGFCTNPSDLIRIHRKKGGAPVAEVVERSRDEEEEPGTSSDSVQKERMDPRELAFGMKDEYGLTLKKHVMDRVTSDLAVQKMGKKREKAEDSEKSEKQVMFQFLQSLSEKERAKIFNKFFSSSSKKHKDKKKKKKERKEKGHKRIKKEIKEEPRSPEESPRRRTYGSSSYRRNSSFSRAVKEEPGSTRSERREGHGRMESERSRHRQSPKQQRSSRHRSRSPRR